MDAVKAEDFTVTERAEQAVVGKEARVVEEVIVGKNLTERDETVSDTLRRTDVEVEQTNANVNAQERDRDNRNK